MITNTPMTHYAYIYVFPMLIHHVLFLAQFLSHSDSSLISHTN